jgi:hypothetical protein
VNNWLIRGEDLGALDNQCASEYGKLDYECGNEDLFGD